MWLNKAETRALADYWGQLDLVRRETLTCYNGIKGDGCGQCAACNLRANGLNQYLADKVGVMAVMQQNRTGAGIISGDRFTGALTQIPRWRDAYRGYGFITCRGPATRTTVVSAGSSGQVSHAIPLPAAAPSGFQIDTNEGNQRIGHYFAIGVEGDHRLRVPLLPLSCSSLLLTVSTSPSTAGRR